MRMLNSPWRSPLRASRRFPRSARRSSRDVAESRRINRVRACCSMFTSSMARSEASNFLARSSLNDWITICFSMSQVIREEVYLELRFPLNDSGSRSTSRERLRSRSPGSTYGWRHAGCDPETAGRRRSRIEHSFGGETRTSGASHSYSAGGLDNDLPLQELGFELARLVRRGLVAFAVLARHREVAERLRPSDRRKPQDVQQRVVSGLLRYVFLAADEKVAVLFELGRKRTRNRKLRQNTKRVIEPTTCRTCARDSCVHRGSIPPAPFSIHPRQL